MKTTLNFDETTMRRLKGLAATRGVTMSELVEGAVQRLLDENLEKAELPGLPVWEGGELLVDIANREASHTAMEDR